MASSPRTGRSPAARCTPSPLVHSCFGIAVVVVTGGDLLK